MRRSGKCSSGSMTMQAPAPLLSRLWNLPCPYCKGRIALSSPEWQSQKFSERRYCPHCLKEVKIAFKASTYAKWFLPLALLTAVGSYLFGIVAFNVLFLAALGIPLLASLHLFPTR